jgi:hypothetical protein
MRARKIFATGFAVAAAGACTTGIASAAARLNACGAVTNAQVNAVVGKVNEHTRRADGQSQICYYGNSANPAATKFAVVELAKLPVQSAPGKNIKLTNLKGYGRTVLLIQTSEQDTIIFDSHRHQYQLEIFGAVGSAELRRFEALTKLAITQVT